MTREYLSKKRCEECEAKHCKDGSNAELPPKNPQSNEEKNAINCQVGILNGNI